MTDRSASSSRKIRILFLAWGFSIHAKRRIQLFVDDPDFSVAVVSTYPYEFANAENISLSGAGEIAEKEGKGTASDAGKVIGKRGKPGIFLLSVIVKWIVTLFDRRVSRREVRRWIDDIGAIRSAARDFHPDVVFLQTLLYPCYLSYFLPRSIPMVITFWNGDVVWWAKWNGLDRLFKKQIVKYGVRRARALTVNSRSAHKACVDYGADAGKIHLIRYPGVDLERFKPLDREASRRKLGINSGRIVLCPRGLGEYLNSHVVVESARRLLEKHPDTLFLFLSGVGGEVVWNRHRDRAVELGIEKNLRWEGQVPWDAMPLYYGSADVMVSISSNDSLPNCMLEAMACGIPVIMGDIPQVRDWVADGINGFLVPVDDAPALSDRIVKVFENSNGEIDSFIRRNLELVAREVDSRKNIPDVKRLVVRTAEGGMT